MTPATSPCLAELTAWDRELLELVLVDSSYLGRAQAAIEALALNSPVTQQILDAYARLVEEDSPFEFGRLLAQFDDPALKNLLVQIDESSANKAAHDRERWFQDLIETHHRRLDEVAARSRLASAKQNTLQAEQLLAQFCEQSKTKHRTEYERRKK